MFFEKKFTCKCDAHAVSAIESENLPAKIAGLMPSATQDNQLNNSVSNLFQLIQILGLHSN